MTDREKVITHLDDMRLFADTRVHQIVSPENWEIYSDLCNFIDLVKEEILALLKEQEPVQPTLSHIEEPDGHSGWWYQCGKCKMPIDYGDRFCRHCGQAVTWK